MTSAEAVIFTLGALSEPGQSICLPNSVHLISSPSQDLVRVRLNIIEGTIQLRTIALSIFSILAGLEQA